MQFDWLVGTNEYFYSLGCWKVEEPRNSGLKKHSALTDVMKGRILDGFFAGRKQENFFISGGLGHFLGLIRASV